jgi:hypothetical protein
MGAREEDPVV